MRSPAAVLLVVLGLSSQSFSQPTCATGLCLQQVGCTGNATTSISGVVYAPNGTDPLPNVTVYIPNAPVSAFTPGVSCPVVGQAPSGSPLVGTTTGVDGSFTLVNVPVGSNIPLVIQAGRWRRQLVIPGTTACTANPLPTNFAVMPKNQSEGDIPKIAIATGSVDSVECVLRKVGIDDAEFTNPNGTGRINLYSGSNSAGALIDSTTPSEGTLMANPATLSQYDVLMLPCQGGQYIQPAAQLANFINFANVGGRVYSSHYSYVWMYNNPPFNGVANWAVNQNGTLGTGTATIDTTFSDGQTLAQWLQLVGASTTQGQIALNTIKHDMNGVIAPSRSWMMLNQTLNTDTSPAMQMTFDTPMGTGVNQCGRVLFNEYHVENPTLPSVGVKFPAECSNAAMTPQEKLLEYSLFDLTNDGGGPTMAPVSADFGSEPVGFQTASQKFIWTNNSTFSLLVSSVTVAGDFVITANSCNAVGAGATCEIDVAFKPTAIGPRTGTLTVATASKTLTAPLTGIGIADITGSPSSLNFGNVDIGGTSTPQVITFTNTATGAVTVPQLLITGDFAVTTTCGSTLAALSTCTISVVFKPTATGARNGTLTVNSSTPAYSELSTSLTGNGVDFSLGLAPTSGSVVAGLNVAANATVTPIAGFSAPVSLSCTTNALASTCVLASNSFTPSATVVTAVTINTTSKYVVVGFGGLGGNGLLSLIALSSGMLLWVKRRSTGSLARYSLGMVFLAAASLLATGCSGQQPALNSQFTAPGSYTYTLTATDGFLTRTATYTLTVTAK
jgi:hypothetical protein